MGILRYKLGLPYCVQLWDKAPTSSQASDKASAQFARLSSKPVSLLKHTFFDSVLMEILVPKKARRCECSIWCGRASREMAPKPKHDKARVAALDSSHLPCNIMHA